MNVKLDENLPAELCASVRELGHTADTVFDEGMVGAQDADLLARARDEGRVLLTMDKGIGDVRVYPPNQYAGIVLFRPPTAGRNAVAAFVRQHLPTLLQMNLVGHLVVVTEHRIRMR